MFLCKAFMESTRGGTGKVTSPLRPSLPQKGLEMEIQKGLTL